MSVVYTHNGKQIICSKKGITDITCKNCHIYGHSKKQCPYHINSYGIVLYNTYNDMYLLVQKKNSYGYVEFFDILKNIKNVKKKIIDISQINVCDISKQERDKILNLNINILINELSFQNHNNNVALLLTRIRNKDILFNYNNITNFSIYDIFIKYSSYYNEQDWEFPKGKRKYNESCAECAIREFKEESGINNITIDKIPTVELKYFLHSIHK